MTDAWTVPDGVPANTAGLMRLDRLVLGARRAVETTVLVRFGVTWGGYLLLCAAASEDRLGYRELADTSRVASATVPHLVDTLYRAKLLSRTTDTGKPGGRVLVTLTDAGRTQLAAIHALVEPLADTLLRGLADLLCGSGTPSAVNTTARQRADVNRYLVGAPLLQPWQLERIRALMPPATRGSATEPGA